MLKKVFLITEYGSDKMKKKYSVSVIKNYVDKERKVYCSLVTIQNNINGDSGLYPLRIDYTEDELLNGVEKIINKLK